MTAHIVPVHPHPEVPVMQQAIDLVRQLGERLEDLEHDGLDAADRVVLHTQLMQELAVLATRVSQLRADAIIDFMSDPERGESLSSVARRAGISSQALSKVHAIERARRGEL